MKYDFDEIIDRKNTNSLSYDGWKSYMFGNEENLVFPYKNEDYIRLWVADMEFSTPPEVLKAIRDRLDRKILGYTSIYDPEYYDVVQSWFMKRYQWKINLEHLVVSPGIIPALNRLVSLLTSDNESVLINTPSYTPFKMACDINDRQVFYSNLVLKQNRYELDFEDIIDQLEDKQKNIKLFIFCNPHNPTGRIWTETELRKIGEICIERNIWIISDEIHCDLLRKGKVHIALASLFPQSDRIITCTAPSKTFNLAGNLMSHVFIPNDIIRNRWTKLYFDLLSPLSVEAVKAAYGYCEEWLEQLKEYLDGNFNYLKAQLNKHLPESKFEVPESTYLAWIDISEYADKIPDQKISKYFAEKAGVLVEDGNMFVANAERYIRLNLACPRSVLKEGIHRIVEVLRK